VPSTSKAPARELAERLASAASAPTPKLGSMTVAELEEIGRTNSIMAELREMLYLFDRPNILDASFTASVLNIASTPIDVVLDEMATAQPAPSLTNRR
jgi:hypothetical protein